MNKKYLAILAVQFVVMAMLLIFGYYKHTMAEAARAHMTATDEYAIQTARRANEQITELREELGKVKEQLKNCQAQIAPK